jgi:hypothetical protein
MFMSLIYIIKYAEQAKKSQHIALPCKQGAFSHQQGVYQAYLACLERFNTQLKVTFGTI